MSDDLDKAANGKKSDVPILTEDEWAKRLSTYPLCLLFKKNVPKSKGARPTLAPRRAKKP